MALSFALTEEEQQALSQLARHAIEEGLPGQSPTPTVPSLSATLSESARATLQRPLGGFVTLTQQGMLRGCIGNIVGHGPLYATIWHMAQAAAFSDPRFMPLTMQEWPHTQVEISVLDELTPCPDPDAVEIGRHGLLLQYRGHSGVFLPQVPVEQGWDRQAYLDNLCRKAGLPVGSWREQGAQLYWYEAQVFAA